MNIELAKAVENAKKGIRDPEAMKKARERMDARREEIRQRIGTVEVAVNLIRELRDE